MTLHTLEIERCLTMFLYSYWQQPPSNERAKKWEAIFAPQAIPRLREDWELTKKVNEKDKERNNVRVLGFAD